MAIELLRDEDDYLARREAAIDREIERAAAGLPPPTVSTKAAAKFLGVHFDTLGEWRRRSPPLGPPFQKGAGSVGGGANQHVRYLYADLVAWRESRSQSSSKERRLIDELERLDRQRRELELEWALQQAKEEVAKLRKRLGRIAKLDTTQSISVDVHDWAIGKGGVLGHVLAIKDSELEQALETGDIWEATVEEALLAPWVDREHREPYANAFSGALSAIETALKKAQAEQQQRDLHARWGAGSEGGERVRPFQGGR